MIAGLVLAVLLTLLMSLAVTVRDPAVANVTLNAFVPETSAALAGRVAALSLEVMPTVSVTDETTFQLASTALAVTLKAVPAICVLGDSVLPEPVPGAAVSPGTNNCSFTNAPT